MGTGSFQEVKSGRGVKLTFHPLLVPWSRNSRGIPLHRIRTVRPIQSLSACTRVHCTFTYTSTPYGPYGLYRASVPVQRCTLPLPIPLLPPMGRTACTEPQCLYNGALYLYLYLYSPYGPYSLYRASVPVQRCTLPLPIPLLPPMGRTACTEPQCLYNGALYLYLLCRFFAVRCVIIICFCSLFCNYSA